jgi:uncharacterized damage-inducible protein DinB
MDVTTIREMWDYDWWVNERLLAMAEELPPERTRERFGASFDTIHGTLGHILGSQINWLRRWQGETPTKAITGDDFQTLADIRSRWQQHQENLDSFLGELTAERLNAPLRYTHLTGAVYELPLWQQLMHVINHGTHHRSELADMLTRVGHPPKPTDVIRYFLEKTGQE